MSTKRVSEKNLVVSTGSGSAASARKSASKRVNRSAALADTPSTSAFEPVNTDPETAVYAPAQEEIAALAHSYWVARGCQGGSPEEDWLRAEQELRASKPAVSVATATL